MLNIYTSVSTEMHGAGYIGISAQWSLDATPLAAAGEVRVGSPGQSLLCRMCKAWQCGGSTCITVELENTVLLSGKSDTLFLSV